MHYPSAVISPQVFLKKHSNKDICMIISKWLLCFSDSNQAYTEDKMGKWVVSFYFCYYWFNWGEPEQVPHKWKFVNSVCLSICPHIHDMKIYKRSSTNLWGAFSCWSQWLKAHLVHCFVLPQAMNTIHMKWRHQTSSNAFQFVYMALAIDITDGCDLSNEVHRELLLKKSKVMLYRPFILIKCRLTSCTILTRFSLKGGRALWVSRLIKEDWPIVL